MYFLLTGEGNSDMGYSEENPGFLVDLLEKLAEEETSGTDVFVYNFVSRTELAAAAEHSDSPKKMFLRGNICTEICIIDFYSKNGRSIGKHRCQKLQ